MRLAALHTSHSQHDCENASYSNLVFLIYPSAEISVRAPARPLAQNVRRSSCLFRLARSVVPAGITEQADGPKESDEVRGLQGAGHEDVPGEPGFQLRALMKNLRTGGLESGECTVIGDQVQEYSIAGRVVGDVPLGQQVATDVISARFTRSSCVRTE